MDAEQVWLVTGASSGFGYALSAAVLAAGGRVAATARNPAQSPRLQELVRAYPGRICLPYLDVTDQEQAHRAVAQTVKTFGRLDVVVNNAGYGGFGALEEFPDSTVRELFDTNVFGSLNVIKAALPILRSQRRGHVVQISSLAGVAPPAPGLAVYAATKFAVEGLNEVLSQEVAHLGIKVTIVEPGDFRTDFGKALAITPVVHNDYAASVGHTAERLTQRSPTTFGDPDRAAQAIIAAVTSDTPPLRLPLGQDALAGIQNKLTHQLEELERWKPISQATS